MDNNNNCCFEVSLKNRPFGVLSIDSVSIDSVSIDSVSIKIDRLGGTGLTSEGFRARVLKKFRNKFWANHPNGPY